MVTRDAMGSKDQLYTLVSTAQSRYEKWYGERLIEKSFGTTIGF